MWFQSKYTFPNILPQGVAWSRLGWLEKVKWRQLYSGWCLLSQNLQITLFFVSKARNILKILTSKKKSFTSVSRHVLTWAPTHMQVQFAANVIVGLLCLTRPTSSCLWWQYYTNGHKSPLLRRGCGETTPPRPNAILKPCRILWGSLSPPCLGGERAGDNWRLTGTFNKCTERRNRKTC